MKNTSTRLNLEAMEVRATPAVLAHPTPVAAAPAAAARSAPLAASDVRLILSLDPPRYNSSKPVGGHVQVKNPLSQDIHYQVLVYWSPTSSLTRDSRPLRMFDRTVAHGGQGSQGFSLTSREVNLPHDRFVIAKLQSVYGTQFD